MIPEKPEWLRKRLPTGEITQKIEENLIKRSLHTICQEGCCPNQGECFSRGIATFLIMGNVCTRNCRFCAVTSGEPQPLDNEEPGRLAEEIYTMKLRFAVITSVTRDDLPDGGAVHFSRVIRAVRQKCPGVGIEVLIPDFRGSLSALTTVVKAKPEVLNHNVETVPRLYREVRPKADYEQSVALLKKVKEIDQSMITKSGVMVGLSENAEDIMNVMDDLRDAECDILTIGQYLRPSKKHHPVYEYVPPEIFSSYKKYALEKGFKYVAAAPFVRSSYMAEESYKRALDCTKE
jgi:lipoic acid synthetase